jgi:hypothetical protein
MHDRVTSFKPLIQFESENMESISMAKLVDLNNTIIADVNPLDNSNDLPQQNNQPTQSK